jgi:hypothetical protein
MYDVYSENLNRDIFDGTCIMPKVMLPTNWQSQINFGKYWSSQLSLFISHATCCHALNAENVHTIEIFSRTWGNVTRITHYTLWPEYSLRVKHPHRYRHSLSSQNAILFYPHWLTHSSWLKKEQTLISSIMDVRWLQLTCFWLCIGCGKAEENNFQAFKWKGTRKAQRVQKLATGWAFRGSKCRWGTKFSIIRSRPNRTWRPPSLLYNRFRCSSQKVKWLGSGVDYPPPPTAEVKNEYGYTSTLFWASYCKLWSGIYHYICFIRIQLDVQYSFFLKSFFLYVFRMSHASIVRSTTVVYSHRFF